MLVTLSTACDLAILSQDSVVLEKQWYINGQNYSKTVKAWLRHHDQQRKAILCLLQVYLDRRCIVVACVLLLWLSCALQTTHSQAAGNACQARQLPASQESYGESASHQLYAKQRLAYMIQCELFGYAGGTEWGVGHYLFRNTKA